MYPAFTIPQCDEAEFARLPAEARHDWFEIRQIMQTVTSERKPRAALRQTAASLRKDGRGKNRAFKTLQNLYYRVIHGESWRCLADMRKVNGGRARWITPEFLAWWRAECGRNARGRDGWGGVAEAHRTLVRRYRAGESIGGVNWSAVWDDLHGSRFDRPDLCPADMELPPGWGYDQLCRRKPPKAFLVSAVNGKSAAKSLLPQVLTTRLGLEPGMLYAFDDLWHDFDVVWSNSQTLRILELCCIDVASGYKPMTLFRPRVRDTDGKRKNLCEADMMFGTCWLLAAEGYNRKGCRLIVEGGTASLPDEFVRRLHAITSGLVTVEWSKPDRCPALACHWQGAAHGNPRGKRWVESSHNLSHNALAHLPGQLGPDSRNNKPEWVEARTRAVQLMLDCADGRLTPDEFEGLRLPLMRYEDGVRLIVEAYERIHRSRDHHLEGWQENRKLRWRTHPADQWHDMDELRGFEPSDRAMIETVIRNGGDRYVQNVQLNRKEVWVPGREDLARIPHHALASLLFDLSKPRRAPDAAQMRFDDMELDPAPMVYRLAECLDPAGCRARLEPGSEYRFLIYPFDASRTLHVMSTTGQYLGSAPRIPAAALVDAVAVEEMVRDTARAVNAQLREIKTIGLPLTLERLDLERHNHAVLADALATRHGSAVEERAQASTARDRRRAATRALVS